MDKAAAERYVRWRMESVPGWLSPADAHAFVLLNSLQVAGGVTGDILEIGVYRGKSAVLLGYLLAPGERLWASDLFGAEATNPASAAENRRWYPGFGLKDFSSTYLRFHAELPEIVTGPSSGLRGLTVGSFRFVHIDGSHVYDDVATDLEIALGLLAPGGVIVLDDVLSDDLPGVAAAAWSAVARGTVTPFALTSKLYCYVGDRPAYLGSFVEELHEDPRFSVAVEQILGRDVQRFAVADPVWRKVARRLAQARAGWAVRRGPP